MPETEDYQEEVGKRPKRNGDKSNEGKRSEEMEKAE